ncbi:MAG: Do family serine endopeptidase [Acidobacteriota bacterium]
MNKRFQFILLLLIVGVSIIFGMVINGMVNRIPVASAESKLYSTAPDMAIQAPSFADIAEKANPAVVSVIKYSKKRVIDERYFPLDDFIWRFFGMPERQDRREEQRQHYRRRSPRQEEFEHEDGGGSGFVISPDGYILTNNHVTEHATRIEVTMENDEKYEAKLIGSDPEIDVALIKIEPRRALPVLPLGDSDKIRVGEWVAAIGNPYMLKHTVTVGVVSAKGRRNLMMMSDSPLATFIQTDAAINLGNSGGPLLNARGEVIGINTAIYRGNLAEGIGFAIPINQVKAILDQLKAKGKVSRGYLGVVVRSVDEKIQDYYKLGSRKGAFVDAVQPGLPGDKAGIRKGDIILSVDGKEIKESQDLVSEISSRSAGDRVKLEIFRDGKGMTLEVKLGERETISAEKGEEYPEKEEESDSYDRFGIAVDNLTSENRYYFEIDERVQGVVIVDVKKFSDAADEGIQEGQVISEVNEVRVKNVSDFNREIRKVGKDDVVKFQIILQDGTSHMIFLRPSR